MVTFSTNDIPLFVVILADQLSCESGILNSYKNEKTFSILILSQDIIKKYFNALPQKKIQYLPLQNKNYV